MVNEFQGNERLNFINYAWILLVSKADGEMEIEISSLSAWPIVPIKLSSDSVGYMAESSHADFIRGRNILDMVAAAEEVLGHLNERRNERLLLKVNFKKAFDTQNWDFVLNSLRTRGCSHLVGSIRVPLVVA